MPRADFIHLRVHSAYSLAEGAIQIKDLAKLAAAEAMPAVALTDTGNLFGALEFAEAMGQAGVQPITGTLLALGREADESQRNGSGAGAHAREPERLILLACNEAGYRNLIKLSSKAFLDSSGTEAAEIHLRDLDAAADGLICLSGGAEGPIGRLLLDGRGEEARALTERLAALFPGCLYIELQRHGLAVEQRCEAAFLDLAHDLDLPLVATNDVYFATPDMHEAHDALLCIDQGVTLGEDDRRRVTAEHYFKPASEMRAIFSDLPEAVDNTLVIARRCAYRAPIRQPILPRFATEPEGEADVLRENAMSGLEQRLATPAIREAIQTAGDGDLLAPYRERLEFELGVITEMGFAGYFLIVADFIRWARNEGIPVGPGRGSGAGSVVAWALGITNLDPLRFGLLFERFLNPDRVSMPDFDIDFCQDRRDRVIHYVQEKYGHDQVAQIITFGKLQARAVLRDVGRVLGMPYGQVDRLCKLVPNNPANPLGLAQALESEPRLREERNNDSTVGRLIDIAMRLEGLYRHASTHAAGVVIGDRPLEELIPLYRDPRSEMPVTQFNMKWVEAAGLVKFDFLGLKTLTVIERALALLARRGIAIDIDAIPLDDGPTYEMLRRAEAVGIFQFESGGMRDLLRESDPSNIEDLIALVALFRPGPMENIPKYIACKHGREAPEHLHETIEPVVKDTYGVIIYQEQVMQIAQVFAGYTLGQADLLRRAMGKKIKAEMEAQRDDFVEGAKARGVDANRASYVFDPGGQVRRLRLQQGPFGGLCAGRLPDGLSEGDPPGRVPGRLHDARHGQHRQAQRLPPGAGTDGDRAAAARHQPLRGRVHGRGLGGRRRGPGALCARRHPKRRARRHGQHHRGAAKQRRLRRPVGFRPADRSQTVEQAAAGEPRARRRLRLPPRQPGPGAGRRRTAAALRQPHGGGTGKRPDQPVRRGGRRRRGDAGPAAGG